MPTVIYFLFTDLIFIINLTTLSRICFYQDVIVIGSADGFRPFTDVLVDDGKCFPNDVTIDPMEDIVILPYSSGTTGLPKGVMLSHFNVVANLRQFKYVFLFNFCKLNKFYGLYTEYSNRVIPELKYFGFSQLILGYKQTSNS